MTKKTVSLVLGSGGARGLAYIGVIRWLEQHDYHIESISGCSMGALIGGIYAAGKLDEYCEWVVDLCRSDILKMLDFSFNMGGLFKGDKIINKLSELVGEQTIESLPINFTAVATNIQNGKEVWFNQGSLFSAIRASIAVPLVFTPVTEGSRIYVDGGLVNPVPIAPTLSDTTDLTITVSVNEPPYKVAKQMINSREQDEDEEKQDTHWLTEFIQEIQDKFSTDKKQEQEEQWGCYEILLRTFEIMQCNIATMKNAMYSPDVSIELSREMARSYEFYRANELIEQGYAATEKVFAELG